MKRYMLRYGLAGGGIMIVLGLLNWWTIAPNFSITTSQVIGYLGIFLALLCVPLGVRYFRDQLNDGAVTFSRAFRIGISISLIVAVSMFLYGMLFHIFQGEEFMEWQRKNLDPESLAKMEAQLDAMPDFALMPWFQGVILALITFFMGLIMTLLSALFLRSSGSGQASA